MDKNRTLLQLRKIKLETRKIYREGDALSIGALDSAMIGAKNHLDITLICIEENKILKSLCRRYKGEKQEKTVDYKKLQCLLLGKNCEETRTDFFSIVGLENFHAIVSIKNPDDHDKAIARNILDVYTFLCLGSINAGNHVKDETRRRVLLLRSRLENKQDNSESLEKKFSTPIPKIPDYSSELKDFISDTENVNCYYFDVSPNLKQLSSPSVDTMELADALISSPSACVEQCIQGRKVITTTIHHNFSTLNVAVFPECRRYRDSKSIKRIYVVTSMDNFKRVSIERISEYIFTYMAYVIYERKESLYSFLVRQNLSIHNNFDPLRSNRIEGMYMSVVRRVLTDIMVMTSAWSAAYREYSASTKSLNLKFVTSSEYGAWDSCGSTDVSSIAVGDYRSSVNAFTFMYCTEAGQYVYIKDLKRGIPHEYNTAGLLSAKTCRIGSRSELCLPVFVGKTPVGVVNIEAPIENAFEKDIKEISDFVSLCGNYLGSIYKQNDSFWMAKRGMTHCNFHELNKHMENFDEETRSTIRKYLYEDIEGSGFCSFEDVYHDIASSLKNNNFIDRISGEEHLSNLKITKVFGVRAANFDFTKFSIVLKTLFENMISHGSMDDHIFVDIVPSIKMKLKRTENNIDRYVVIECLIVDSLASINSDSMFVEPLVIASKGHEETGRKHYGLYLVGLITRSMGGWCNYGKVEDGQGCYIRIVMPIKIFSGVN